MNLTKQNMSSKLTVSRRISAFHLSLVVIMNMHDRVCERVDNIQRLCDIGVGLHVYSVHHHSIYTPQ